MEYSRKYVETALRAIAAEHPHRTNPQRGEGPGCAYNGPNGTHCIAGQFLANEGFTVSDDWEGEHIGTVAEGLSMSCEDSAVKLLLNAQERADRRWAWAAVVSDVI